MNSNKSRWLLSLLELTGVAAIFLPFAFHTSPWDVVIAVVSLYHFGRNSEFLLLAVPFFLAAIISALSFLDLAGKRLPGKLAWSITILGLIAGPGLTDYFDVATVLKGGTPKDSGWVYFGILVPLLCVLPFGLALLGKLKKYPATAVAHATLRAGYLPNAVLCLVGFSDQFTNLTDLQIGAAFAAATVVLYVVQGGIIVARGRSN